MHRLAPLALALAACAGAPLAPDPPDPTAFRDVRRVALVRHAERGREPRPKDPLDAVRESLEQRGVATQTLEVGPRERGDLAELDRLYARVESRIAGASGAAAGRAVDRVGPVAPLLERLAVQAVALYVRFDGPPPLGGPSLARPPLGGAPGLAFPPPGMRSGAALALVGRDGALVWFDWGGGEEPAVDGGRPVNAAEAVDALVHVLTGEGTDGDAAP